VKRAFAALAVATFVLAACTDGDASEPGRTSETPAVVSPEPTGSTSPSGETGSAAAALERLCTVEPPKVDGAGSDVPPEGPTPPEIQQVMDELEEIRGFGFDHPVVAEPVTQREIAEGFRESLDAGFPEDLSERRSLTWQTIGVISAGTEIRDELSEYGGSQVIGYYDTQTEELVFLGGEDPTPLESVTLAHELTHAIDDQRFGLERLDSLSAECRDDRSAGALALVEGSATFFMYQWARTFLTPDEQVELVRESASQEQPATDVAPFIEALQIWPYTAGLSFVTALQQRGGVDAIDAAFTELPVSSEQVMHPERYPNDVPTPLDVEDLGPDLGAGWEDLDVMEVGEVWLETAFKLRLGDEESETGAAGWDGGLYRAWTDGDAVAVVLETAWDSEQDATEFADAMRVWLAEGDTVGEVVEPEGSIVRVLVTSDAVTLEALRAAGA